LLLLLFIIKQVLNFKLIAIVDSISYGELSCRLGVITMGIGLERYRSIRGRRGRTFTGG
jgi:hypothetical protein